MRSSVAKTLFSRAWLASTTPSSSSLAPSSSFVPALLHSYTGVSKNAVVSNNNVHSRGFAAAAADAVPQLPPQFGIPGRYAAALYMASFKAKALDKVQKEVESIATLIRSSPELKAFVTEPGMPAKQRAAGLHKVLDKMGVTTSVTKRFVDVVVENKRTKDLEGMLDTFGEIVAQQKGQVKASVTTAKALSKAELDNVKSGLKKLLKEKETLVLEEKVDPSIISGIVIDIGDKHVDMSVQTRVKKLQQIIRNA